MHSFYKVCFLFLSIQHLVLSKTKKKHHEITAFDHCDADKSGGVDKDEFELCAKFPPAVGKNKRDATHEIFRLFDLDSDDKLAPAELKSFLKVIAQNEQEVDVVLEDGSRQSMPQSEFLKMAEQRTNGMKMEDGKMTRVDEGSEHLDKLKKENPELARFIIMGQWAHANIASLGYANGSIVNLRSLDDDVVHSPNTPKTPTNKQLEVCTYQALRQPHHRQEK
jgi:3-methyladenine DNA glycosylase AlkC